MATKIAGIIMIITFTTALGIMVCDYKKKQIRYIDKLIYLGDKIILLLSGISPETNEILHQIMIDKRLEGLSPEALEEGFLLDAEELERVKGLFDILGKYDADYQITYLNEFTGHYKMLKEEYRQHYLTHHRLYLAIGVLSGAFISVLTA